MLWKIIVIVAAFFLFRRARRRRPALTCLKLWRKTLYRRHKPVEAELLRVEERNGTNLLVCDVPSLQKHALIFSSRNRNFSMKLRGFPTFSKTVTCITGKSL